MGKSLGGQRDHQIVHPGQAALPLADQLRLEAAGSVPRHLDFDRPDVGQHGFRAGAVAGVATVAAGRVVLGVAEVIVHFAFDRGLHHCLRQPGEKAALAGQLQPLRACPVGELRDQLLVQSIVEHHRLAVAVGLEGILIHNHFSHRCLLS